MTEGFADDAKSESDGRTDGQKWSPYNVLFLTPQRTSKIYFFCLPTLVSAGGGGSSRR
jgi:hypothetical protein